MFTIAEVIKLLTRIFAKANKRFPKGLEAVDIRLKAKKIHDVGKANNYKGAISENQLKQFLAFEKQAKPKEVIVKEAADVFDLTGKKIDTSRPIMGGKNVPETEAQIKAKIDAMNKKTVANIKARNLFATEKEFASELESLRLNIIRNDPQFNLEITERYKLPGEKTYTAFPDKEPGKLLSPPQRQKLLDQIKDVMKHDEYQTQFGENFNFTEITDDLFRIDKASGGLAGMLGEPTYADEDHQFQLKIFQACQHGSSLL